MGSLQCKPSICRVILVFFLLASCAGRTNNHQGSETREININTEDDEQQGMPLTDFNLSPVEDIVCGHFVAPDGNDDALGSEQAPWASFQKAAESAKPGDTVCFRRGAYVTDDIHLTRSGEIDALITFAAYPGEQPVLDGNGQANELLVLTGGVSHIRISGFRLQNFRIWGIFLTGGNEYVFLDHLEVAGGETSIRFTYGESSEGPALEGMVENILLEDSLIWGSQYSAVDCTPGPCNHITIRQVEVFNTGVGGESFYGSDGIEFARGQHVLVEDCYVHDNGGDGIDLGSRDREGHSEGVIVRRNQVERNHLNGIKVWAGGRIENNSIWGQGNSAIWAGTFNCAIEIINNTVAYNMWDEGYSERNWAVVVGYPEELPSPEVALTMVNNIFAFNATPLEGGGTGLYFGPGVVLTESHNLFFSRVSEEIMVETNDSPGFSQEDILSGRWQAYSRQGEGDLAKDPLFISGWPDVDLHLQPESPAINAGNHRLAPDEDIFLQRRDDQPDLGAYEY